MNNEIKLKRKSPLKYILIFVAVICLLAFLISRNDLQASGETTNSVSKPETTKVENKEVNSTKDNDRKQESFRTETTSSVTKPKESVSNDVSNTDNNKPITNNNTKTESKSSNNTNTQDTKPIESNNKPTGHYETRTEVIPEWYEKVLVKDGYYEDVLVKQAYDEKQSYCLVYGYDKIHVFICGQCGYQASSYEAINAHFDSSKSCGSYSEQNIDTGEAHCLSYGEDIIHHDAVYERIYHEPEYTIIHHPEEIKEYQVWVND